MEIVGTERVEALTIVHNELYESEDGAIRPRPTERRTTMPLGLVFRAIGYQGVPLPGIPFDAMRGVIPNEAGRIIEPRTGGAGPGRVRGRLDQARPPGDHRDQQARLPGDRLTACWPTCRPGNLHKDEVPSREVLERLLGERRRDFVSYEDWQLIDLLEQERGARQRRARGVKFSQGRGDARSAPGAQARPPPRRPPARAS